MIRVISKKLVKADKVDEFIALAKKLIQETNQNDVGCISYELYQDETRPQILTFMEQWEDKEALQRHMAANHFKEVSPLLRGLVEEPGEANIYHKLA